MAARHAKGKGRHRKTSSFSLFSKRPKAKHAAGKGKRRK